MKIILFVIIFLYLSAMAYLYFFQNSILFNAGAIKQEAAFEVPNMEHISLKVHDSAVLDGVYKHSESKNAPLLIYFGGNADDATRILLYTKDLTDFNIVAFNYRGYLKSSGKPSEKNLFNDALKIYDTYGKNKKVIIIGRSLGTAVATYLSSQRKVDGLVLITPYDSIVSIAKDDYPIFPIDLLLKNKFESTKYMAKVQNPVALIEVEGDTTVTHKHFEKLKESVPHLVSSVLLHGTTHADVLSQKDFEKTLKEAVDKML
ncbi:MAG: alpha/beta fold hydrolase [Sulfurospirillaceae bacterium]|nr:alpha/beta fold hydrolase [Sulfurospirillaceae bacterium]